MKKFVFTFILIFLAILYSLAFLEGVLRLASLCKDVKFSLVDDPGKRVGVSQYDETLGWKNRPQYKELFHLAHRDVLEKINSSGWRDRKYALAKGENVFRIAVVGCSRTYGYGVNMEETFSKELERRLNAEYARPFEVLNFGVNGYGLTQMALNYLMNVRKYSPDLVFLQFYAPTIHRMAYTQMWGTPKPAYVLKDGELLVLNVPVPLNRFNPVETWFLKRSLLYKFIKQEFLKDKEMLRHRAEKRVGFNKNMNVLAAKILAYLNAAITRDGSRLVVFTWGENTGWSESIFNSADVEYFVLDDFADFDKWRQLGDTENPPPAGHWSPIGHKFVAEAMMHYLESDVFAKDMGFSHAE